MKQHIQEILDKILKMAMDKFLTNGDLGNMMFFFDKQGVSGELPLVPAAFEQAKEIMRKDLEGIAICGKMEIKEPSLIVPGYLDEHGKDCIAIVYRSNTEHYLYFVPYVRHEILADGKLGPVKFRDVRKWSHKDGFKLTDALLTTLFPGTGNLWMN
jgi:hypothetical protein